MKKTYLLVVSFVLAVLIVLAPAIARAVSQVYITGVQTSGGTGHTTDDFIELFNPNPEAISLKDFVLVKRTASATADSAIKSWTEDTLIPGYSFYLWANSSYGGIGQAPDITTSSSVADNNGIALRYGGLDAGQLVDALSWGQSSNGFALVSGNIPANSVLRRQDLFAAQSSYALLGGAIPRNSSVQELPIDPPPEETPPPETDPDPEQPPTTDPPSDPPIVVEPPTDPPPIIIEPPPVVPPVVYLPLKITEVLPNPTGTDTGQEAVELYNPNNAAVDITGWFLGDGLASVPASSALELSGSIGPGQYKAIVIPSGKFTLNNTGGDSVQLFSPDKIVVDSVTYTGTAAENNSFQRFDQGWLWLESSMGLANVEPPTEAGQEGEQEEEDEPAIVYSGVTITEFYPAFGTGIATPMLEVVNRSGKEVDLERWKIDVVATHLKKPSDSAFTIDNSNVVARDSYGIVVLANVNSVDFDPAGKYWVILYSPDGKSQDAVNVKSIVSRLSYAKVGTLGWEWAAWSPLAENLSFIAPGLEFTEILPAYKDAEVDAFAEFWNPTTEPVFLGNLKIKIGTKGVWLPDYTLQPKEYYTVFAEDLPAALTTAGKKVLLLDANDKLVASVSYPKAKTDLALMAQEDGKWVWTAEPTPGAANIFEPGQSFAKAPAKIVAKPVPVKPAITAGANTNLLPPEETSAARKNSKKPIWVFGALGAVLFSAAAVVWFMAKEPTEPEVSGEVSSS